MFLEYHPLSYEEKNRLEDLTAQLKVVVSQTPNNLSIPTKKIKMGFNHIPIYEGEEGPNHHCFVCEKFLDATDITFGVVLRHRALTWFMNYTKKQTRSKEEIKDNFLTFFKIQDITHLAAQKLKEIKQILGELVREYYKRFKDLLSQIPMMIDHKLLVQWYVTGLLPRICSSLSL